MHLLDTLQSRRAGLPIISAVFQWDQQRLLAWRTSCRRCPHIDGYFRIAEGLVSETSAHGKSQDYQGRQGFLQSHNDRIPGISRSTFCDCGQSDKAYQEKTSWFDLQELFIGKRKYRSFLPADQMAKEIPVCSYQASDSGRTIRIAQPFSIGKYSYQVIVTNLRLNALNIWKFYNGRAAVELIIKELKEDYQLAKIPTKYFAANETYFSSSSICLQSDQLVQATLLTREVSENDA